MTHHFNIPYALICFLFPTDQVRVPTSGHTNTLNAHHNDYATQYFRTAFFRHPVCVGTKLCNSSAVAFAMIIYIYRHLFI